MRILLTNDDGIYAEGIYALYRELNKVGDVTVVAPDSERSSVGHGITLSHPIRYQKVVRNNRFFGYGISGTPADCVKFGTSVLMRHKPDMVISGINQGCNDGCSVFYSGTIAGAREGSLLGIPSIAFSLDSFVDPEFREAAVWSRKVVRFFMKHTIPDGHFMNVNIPFRKGTKRINGVRFARQGREPILGSFLKRQDPNIKDYYWMTGQDPQVKKNDGSDTCLLKKGYVTVVPLSCDMTSHSLLETLIQNSHEIK